jgi:hypothetical protein
MTTTLHEESTDLIEIGGGYYWVEKVGGKKVQLSKKKIAAGGYIIIEPEAAASEAAETADSTEDAEVLRAQLREAAKVIEKQKAELEANKPTVNIRHHLFETIEDVKAFYPEKQLRDMALAEIASINKTRMKQGYDPIRPDKEELAELITETMEDLLADRKVNGAPEEGPLLRTLKMVAPDGSLRQIPYEGQFNNIAGSLEDGYRKYTKKGFKRTEPMLCPAGGCWEVSAEENGEMVHTGYCSVDHFGRTEAGVGAPVVPGVTTRGSISGRGSED